MYPSQSYLKHQIKWTGCMRKHLGKGHVSPCPSLAVITTFSGFHLQNTTVAAALEDMGVHEVEEIWLALEKFAFEFFQQRSVPALSWEIAGPTFAQIHWVGFWASVREHLASEALSVSAQVVGSRTGACWLKQTSFVSGKIALFMVSLSIPKSPENSQRIGTSWCTNTV